jgi:hypothetical protein
MAGIRIVTQTLPPAGSPMAQKRVSGNSAEEDWRQLRPRNPGELLDQTVNVYVANFGLLVGFAVLCYVPLHLFFDAVVRPILVREGFEVAMTTLRDVLPGLLTTALVTLFVGSKLLGRERSLGEHVLQSFSSLPGMLVFYGVRLTITMLLCCVFLVPGGLAYWLLASATAIYLLEGPLLVQAQRRRGGGWFPLRKHWLSLGRSRRLAWGSKSLGRYLAAGAAVLLLAYPLIMINAFQENPSLRASLMSMEMLDSQAAKLVIVLMGAVSLATGTVLLDIFVLLFYFDLRVRREALDLELELEALESRSKPR